MDCKQARKYLVGDLDSGEEFSFDHHLQQCVGCRAMAEEQALVRKAVLQMREESADVLPSEAVAARVLAEFEAFHAQARRPWAAMPWQWLSASVVALVALVAIAMLMLAPGAHKAGRDASAVARQEDAFTAMPYVVPPAPYERTSVVRTQVSLQVMEAAGFAVHGDDLGATTLADVVCGEDGRVLAIRLVPESSTSSERRMD